MDFFLAEYLLVMVDYSGVLFCSAMYCSVASCSEVVSSSIVYLLLAPQKGPKRRLARESSYK